MPLNESPESSKPDSETEPQSLKSTSLMTQTSPTPPTEAPGKSLKGTRGGRDGAAIRTKKNKIALDNMEHYAGGREAVIDLIGSHKLDKREEHFLRLLCDPARNGDSMVTICRDAGLSPNHIIDMLRDGAKAQGTAIGITIMAQSLPEVAQDIVEKSVDALVQCPNCLGEGYTAEDVKCTACHGRGEVFRSSDIDRQKMLADYTGLAPKKSGINIMNQQNVGVSSSGTMFSKYVKMSDEAAYDVVDVTPEAEDGK